MKVLMLGWEFPPYISGGLGTACYGLTKGLTELGVQVLFVLPRAVYAPHHSHVTVLTPAGAATGATLDPEESAYLHDLPRLRIEEVDVAPMAQAHGCQVALHAGHARARAQHHDSHHMHIFRLESI